MMMTLGEAAFYPRTSRKHEHCLLGIFHSLSLKEYKERLIVSFKGQGPKRVAIATTALSMGVNFPDVRYIVHFGPARTLLDFHQQAGRAGGISESLSPFCSRLRRSLVQNFTELKHQTFSRGRRQPEVKFTSYPRFPPTGSAVATLRRLCFAYFDVACRT